jgi:hypothetical protein
MEFLTKNLADWTSGNEILDKFIQEKQLEYTKYGVVFEWIPYDKFMFIGIKKVEKSNIATAIWEEGPLYYFEHEEECIRVLDTKVILRILYDSENITNEFINKVMKFFTSLV